MVPSRQIQRQLELAGPVVYDTFGKRDLNGTGKVTGGTATTSMSTGHVIAHRPCQMAHLIVVHQQVHISDDLGTLLDPRVPSRNQPHDEPWRGTIAHNGSHQGFTYTSTKPQEWMVQVSSSFFMRVLANQVRIRLTQPQLERIVEVFWGYRATEPQGYRAMDGPDETSGGIMAPEGKCVWLHGVDLSAEFTRVSVISD